jgi:hypothetical protein
VRRRHASHITVVLSKTAHSGPSVCLRARAPCPLRVSRPGADRAERAGSDDGDSSYGISFAAICNSRSSHDQYTRSSTEHFEYGAVTSARLLGQNYRNRKYSKVRNYVLDKHPFSNQTMAASAS